MIGSEEFYKVFVAQSCLTLCDPMDWGLPGCSVYRILQARILEWVAISFSRGSSQPRDQTWVSRIAGRCFTIWATRELSGKELQFWSLLAWVQNPVLLLVNCVSHCPHCKIKIITPSSQDCCQDCVKAFVFNSGCMLEPLIGLAPGQCESETSLVVESGHIFLLPSLGASNRHNGQFGFRTAQLSHNWVKCIRT